MHTITRYREALVYRCSRQDYPNNPSKAGQKQVKSIDVGGGIPTDYHADEEKVNFSQAEIQTSWPIYF